MIRFKIDIIKALSEKGVNTSEIRKRKIISEGTLQKIRTNKGEPITTATINTICQILKKQPGAILEWIPDPATDQDKKTE